MSVIVSTRSNRKVYHTCGCFFERRMNESNKKQIPIKDAKQEHMHECCFCKALKNHIPVDNNFFHIVGCTPGMEFQFDRKTQTFYFRTDIGFWKIFDKNGNTLMHRNGALPKRSFEFLKHGDVFHRQKDVKKGVSLTKAVRYISEHDKAMKIIDIDYRLLPQRTFEQKQYYKKAETISRKRAARRLDALLDQVSGGQVDLKVSAW